MSDQRAKLSAVAKLLICIAEAEAKVEYAKKRMVENPDFNSIEGFRRLTDEDAIRLIHIKRFLRDNGFTPSDEELDLLMKNLDRDHDGVLTWGEYLNSCINREFSPDDTSFPRSWRVPRELPIDVEKSLAEVLICELEAALEIEEAKNSLIPILENLT